MDKEDFFKKFVYMAMALILSLNGYDIVKQESPQTAAKLEEVNSRLAKVEESLALIISGRGVIITRQ